MNFKRLMISLGSVGLLLFSVSVAYAEDSAEDKAAAPIPGRQLMTEQERDQYRTAMQALETEEERAALRESHRKEMQSRAREQGVELRDGAGKKQKRRETGTPENRARRIRERRTLTVQEKKEYREKMRAATTAEERTRLRAEKREKMEKREREQTAEYEKLKARARELGEELPDEPTRRGGAGKGRGQGKGQENRR